MTFDKQTIKNQMHNGIVTVVFTKADGSPRVLKGTLLAEHLPKHLGDTEDANHPTRKVSDDVLAVWDIENKGWRSFRLDSIKEIIL